jgi:chromosome segregation ATPase
MEKKLEEKDKHLKYLYDELEEKEKEIHDLKESLDHANDICTKNTAYAQRVLVEKCSLSQELERKEKEIFELKQKESKCKNGCENYNKSIDEIYDAGNKHREKLLALKEIAETQKSQLEQTTRADELQFANQKLENEEVLKEMNLMKQKIKKLECNRDVKDAYTKQLDDLTNQRKEEFIKLKNSIANLKPKKKQNCRFGWKCKKVICEFDHTYLHKKVNQVKPQANSDLKCKEIFVTKPNLNKHMNDHQESFGSRQKSYPCECCSTIFSNFRHIRHISTHTCAMAVSQQVD